MPQPRALSLVKQGSVTLMNDWLARRWSVIVGQTTDLQQRGQEPWIDLPTPEFRLTVDGRSLGLMDLDEVEWVEDCSPLGAEVAMQRQNERLVLELRTFVFHHRPGLVRRSRILNKASQPVSLDAAWTELLPLGPDVTCHTEGLDTPALGIDWLQTRRVLAVERQAQGFLVAAGAGGCCTALEDSPYAATGLEARRPLAPGAWLSLPAAFMLPYTGSRKNAWDTQYEPFLRHVQSIEEYDQERAAAAQEPPEDVAETGPSGAPGN